MVDLDRDETPLEHRLRESAEFAEQHMDDEPGPEINVRVAKNLKHVYSLRIGADELDEIVDAAEVAGQNVSEFIRNAALAAARRRISGESSVEEVRRKAKELSEAVERL